MKQLSVETVGGRIRKVRKDAKMTIQEFSEKIGVTANYMGLVERGERNPSLELLDKIRKVMDISIEWLQTGDVEHTEEYPRQDLCTNALQPVRAINPQLFLSLVLSQVSDISRDTLATILMTSPETVDDILSGKPVVFDPRWYNSFSVLAQHMNLTELRQDLHNLDSFLAQEECAAQRATILHALQTSGIVQQYTIVPSSQNIFSDSSGINIITLKRKGQPSDMWECRYYPRKLEDKDSANNVLSELITTSEENRCKVSIIVDSDDSYNALYDCMEKRKGELDELEYPLPRVSLLFFDIEKGTLEETNIFSEE